MLSLLNDFIQFSLSKHPGSNFRVFLHICFQMKLVRSYRIQIWRFFAYFCLNKINMDYIPVFELA